ncbi:MAG: DUF1573 domain-containing protein [Planctomycetes bacterium]|nr:DUF1573 domain-containing protein [Planctomycetota bacterium]
MKRFEVVGPLLLLGLGAWLCVPTARDDVRGATGGALIVESARLVDFGTLAKGADVFALAVVSNPGGEPVRVRRIRTTCGCTVIKPSTDVIDPGATLELEIRPNTWTLGAQASDVYVEVDGSPVELLAAEVRFAVVEQISVLPSAPRIEVRHGAPAAETALVVHAQRGPLPHGLTFAIDRPGVAVRSTAEAGRVLVWLRPEPAELARGVYYATLSIRADSETRTLDERAVLVSHDAERVRFEPVLLYGESSGDAPVRVSGRLDWDGVPVIPTHAKSLSPDATVRSCVARDDGGFELAVERTSTRDTSVRFDVLYETPLGPVIGGVVVGARFDAAGTGDRLQSVPIR